jgi:NAD+ synthase/NAD+ synthase (glutamine-hydrolysing)
MKIALLQLNFTVGDLEGNSSKIVDAVEKAEKAGAQLAITSELAITGYPPKDYLLNRSFINQTLKTVKKLAEKLNGKIQLLVGLPIKNKGEGRPLFNAAALLKHGEIFKTFKKSLLPTYDVFDEDRYFEPSSGEELLEIEGEKIGITICEDIWNDKDFWERPRYHMDPLAQLVNKGSTLVINLSSSPFTVGKQIIRESMLSQMAAKHKIAIFYVNQVGGNDDLIFDGRSMVYDGSGKLLARGKGFQEDIILIDWPGGSGIVCQDDFIHESEIWRALVVGTKDYVKKCGFSKTLLGLSGGIDSSLTACIAVEALGSSSVLGVLMPSPYSSRGSVEDALKLAGNLNIKTITLPIKDLMKVYAEVLKAPFTNYFADVTEENIQARIRGNLLMALSNKFHSLLLTTGNKSELAVGYCTLYGDMSGGLAIISDVPKTMVYAVSRWYNDWKKREIIPQIVFTKAPSAELKPDQTDQDFLPSYEVLDAVLKRVIELHLTPDEIVQDGFDEQLVRKVLKMIKQAEFKRKQAAPGLKVTDRAFGTGWCMPIAAESPEVKTIL